MQYAIASSQSKHTHKFIGLHLDYIQQLAAFPLFQQTGMDHLDILQTHPQMQVGRRAGPTAVGHHYQNV